MKINVYRFTMVLLCVAGIFFTGQSVQAQGLSVVIPSEVTVTGQYFTLGDIASVTGDDNERIESLRKIRLGHTPQPGQSFVLAKDIVMARMNATNADLTGITWHLPAQLRVTALSQLISGQELVSQAEQYLQASLTGAHVDITAIGQQPDILVPPGQIALKMDLPYGIRYNSPTSISVGIAVDGQVFTTVRIRFDIKKYEQVAVATKVLSAHEVITADAIIFESRDIGRLSPGYFTDLNKILGLTVKRQVAPGVALTENMLKKPVLIQRGKPVSIVARIGSIQVIVPGTALQNGSENQFIRVKNSTSQKIIIGQVVDDTTVLIKT